MPFDGQSVPTPIADALRRVLDGGKKWCKYDGTDVWGRHCILGALYEIDKWNNKERAAFRAAIMAIDPDAPAKAERENGIHYRGSLTRDNAFIALWNNAVETTYADIERAIDAFADIESQRALVNA